MQSARRLRLLLSALGTAVACAGSPATPSEHLAAAAADEAQALCSPSVSAAPPSDTVLGRRLALEQLRMSQGGMSMDDAAGRAARAHAHAWNDCLDVVLPALEGESGQDTVRILQDARRACEADGLPPESSALNRCIHERKLQIFRRETTAEGPAERETLDRLLRAGGGAPLSAEERAAYCRTRELGGTGHSFCD